MTQGQAYTLRLPGGQNCRPGHGKTSASRATPMLALMPGQGSGRIALGWHYGLL